MDSTQEVEDTLDFIKYAMRQASENEGLQCAIQYENRLVGMIGFHKINKNTMTGEIGYWLSKEVNGKGIMTKCVKEIISIGFKFLHLRKIEIHCAIDNTRSRSIPEKLQFKQEGVIRRAGNLYDELVDHVIYGLLDSEWTG